MAEPLRMSLIRDNQPQCLLHPHGRLTRPSPSPRWFGPLRIASTSSMEGSVLGQSFPRMLNNS